MTTDTLIGHFLIAMPGMSDPRFERTVIYMCAHSEAGALGLVVNRLAEDVTFPDLMAQLGLEPLSAKDSITVHFGGPVEQSRGFVLHSADYLRETTMVVSPEINLTASLDVLTAIADGTGPRRKLLALGYAGWGPGQLESEIQANGWLHGPVDQELLFSDDVNSKWQRSVDAIGLDPAMLSGDFGHA